ncbi:MAG: response regulator transcription factor [Candidatus Binataceae bacterium]
MSDSERNSAPRIKVLLADDHHMVREALRMVLEPECEIVGEAASGEEALALAARTRPQVVVLDIGMPGMGGLAAAHRIAKQAPGVRVLVLSQYADEEYVIEALSEARVAGYLVKTDAAAELLNAIRAVHGGKRYLSPSVAPIVLGRLDRPFNHYLGSDALSRREREVLKLIAEGSTTKEVAARLGISPKTAQAHRENLKEKLDLHSTAAMVRYAIKHKLVRID